MPKASVITCHMVLNADNLKGWKLAKYNSQVSFLKIAYT